MPVADEQVDTMRALLTGNHDEYRTRREKLNLQRAAEWSALVAAACFEAVECHFPSEISASDVAQYVGDLRVRMDESGDLIEPTAAERVTRFNLGDPRIETNNDLDEAAFNEFMAAVRTYADELVVAAEQREVDGDS